ncbi:Similar to Transcriptional activator protein UGA3; acc. no. P26370 [Pyronema omphalodes CBS 100304]|uniref:Similar to Transcriptional activator protein UGA3 acc. no. P26370 n=1 Tax=Pyronema omphalodes (strain CBS 100304) TaxID=1076935 RepID=U4LBN0_PYROM|nr:Similar to Transcriptional activator protein UGA3; acc. no. P26370 [Pyronema omphalodes CBS 100304]
MGTPPKLRACDRCASIKQVCDREGKDSCSRCTRLELRCAITRVHKPMGRPKKKPAVTTDISIPQQSAESDIKDEQLPPSPVDSVDSLDINSLDLSTTRPTTTCRVKRVQRTRSGCITCKQRRKKCDEVLPVCGDCTRLGLVCQRPIPRSPQSRRGSVSSTISSSSSSSESSISSSTISRRPPYRRDPNLPLSLGLYDGCTSQEQHLLQHYAHVVSRSLSVVPDEINSFISIFVPMAIQQPAMRNALLGLSATHLKRIHSSFELAAVEYQNKALKQANQLLKLGTSDAAMEGLAAVLFLCLQEVCEGKSRKWPMHLEAAVTIINDHGGPSAYPDSVKFLIETVAYFDAIATLSFSKSAYLDQQFYVPPPAEAMVPAHALFGTAHALFAIIADISHLAQVRHIRYTSPVTDLNFRTMAGELELQLQEWTPAPCSSLTTDPHLHQKVTAAGIMLQWAALMRLHLIQADDSVHDIGHPMVRVAVSNILTALETIPRGDLVESMLIFPVFAAGFGALLPEERRAVDERFAVMEKSIGFGNVFDAHEAVLAHWQRMDQGLYDGRQVTWEEVIRGTPGGTLIMS